MKRSLLSMLFLLLVSAGFAGEWVAITSQRPVDARTQVIKSDITHPVFKLTLGGFQLNPVTTPNGPAYTVTLGKTTRIQEGGAPDLPKMTASFVIPDMAGMEARVVSSVYRDFTDLDIAPSKGIITRDVDPATVPYQYGPAYTRDQFFPEVMTGLADPYIIRDIRGQTVTVYPFAYNPVTRTLRVYYEMTVELVKVSENGVNQISRANPEIRINHEWASVYAEEFENFDALTYTPLNDYGNMLVIANSAFVADMQPYVEWKNSIGIPTVMVTVDSAGGAATAIKAFIANYYNTNGLTFVLLVGDNAQVPTNQGGDLGGPSDNAYGYIVGNDHYADAFVGRFSAENVAHVQTQVARTINYEKNPQLVTDDWYTTVIGIGSSQGTGDDNEYDYEHIRNLQTECLAYNYTMNPELFDGSQGGNDASGNPTPSMVATEVNNGGGLILYTGHGSETSWGTTGFSNNNVNQLTNQDKLPFIWSVACVNGNFLNTTCFAEAWLRASQNGQPTGAVGFLGSTINQSWNSPMEGQDEMVKILTEEYPGNIKRTFGGLSINGCMKMIDAYGNDGSNMADTWNIFGDPSLMVRTDNPQMMTVTHDPTVFVGATSLTVNCNVEGARATATIDGQVLATGLVSGGSVTLSFAALQDPQDTLHLVVTAYNYIPDISDLQVITPNGPYIVYVNNMINDAAGNNNHLAEFNEDIYLTVTVKNLGVAATSDLNIKVKTNDTYVLQSDSLEVYGVIDPNQAKSVEDAFFFHLSGNIPDGHVIPFTMTATDDTLTWTSSFSITAHAPAIAVTGTTVADSSSNDNGRLDPGETTDISIVLQNNGSASASSVMAHLVAINPEITVNSPALSYGDLAFGQQASNLFNVTVDPAAVEGQPIPFMLEISANGGFMAVATFTLIVGRMPMIVVDFDGNANSGPAIKSAGEALGLLVDYNTSLPASLNDYKSLFVCLGTYPNAVALTDADGTRMQEFLEAGGRAYMEGGDTWFYDTQTPVHPLFHIAANGDGSGDLSQIIGQTATITQGMSFGFNGDNQYIDRITGTGAAMNIFKNQNPSYVNAVAYDGGTYRTIGSSFEFGGLTDGAYPSTKNNLLEEYLNFFGIGIAGLEANFAAYPTTVAPGGSAGFYDFSTGGASSWNWSFPGGTPETSSEQNPCVFYNALGSYDVQLIVSNGISSDTLVRTGYIDVAYPTGSCETNGISASIMPNPNNGSFRLNLASAVTGKVDVRIFSLLGAPVYQNKVRVDGNASLQIDLNVPDGMYILHLQGDNTTLTKRIMIHK